MSVTYLVNHVTRPTTRRFLGSQPLFCFDFCWKPGLVLRPAWLSRGRHCLTPERSNFGRFFPMTSTFYIDNKISTLSLLIGSESLTFKQAEIFSTLQKICKDTSMSSLFIQTLVLPQRVCSLLKRAIECS